MHHHQFIQADTYQVAILSKLSAFDKDAMRRHYVDRMVALGVPEEAMIAFTLNYNSVGKAPVAYIKDYLDVLMPVLQDLQIKYLYVTDGAYFKVLTNEKKSDVHQGYVLPCAIKGYEHMYVVMGMNYQQLIYNPVLSEKLAFGINALASHVQGSYSPPGKDIIRTAVYPTGHQAVQEALNALLGYPALAADIEAFSLRFNHAGVGTIAFSPNQQDFVAFPCDYEPCDPYQLDGKGPMMHGKFVPDPVVREMIKQFFIDYKGKITWHNSNYDCKVIIYTLWMKDGGDTAGLLDGLEVMNKFMDDTKLIAYLATNTTAGNVLGLKKLAQEFAGNWAVEDIKDIRQIPLKELLQYNGVDCLSTNYVRDKYYPIMVQDKQEALYKDLFLPSAKLIMQMELTGMPMSKKRIVEVKAELTAFSEESEKLMRSFQIITDMDYHVAHKAMTAANLKLKVKQHPLQKFLDDPECKFNPNSPLQLQVLLFEKMGLPIIDLTDTKQPATGAKTLKKLLNHITDPDHLEVVKALIDFSSVAILLSTFIPAFEEGIDRGQPGILWLHGSFVLGGTVSGRMSSNSPNLQNIPSGSRWAKLIKTIFTAPECWLFCGADFSSLEDRINALLTKDPNKLKVYTDGYDSHSLRCAAYFPALMPDITEALTHAVTIEDRVTIINSIAEKYSALRGKSKAPTFALTFQGTWLTLVKNVGFTPEEAKDIEHKYHELYVVSDEWVQAQLKQASKDGYAEGAFGLRIRVPLLKQVMYGSSSMPKEAAAEARTLGNAISGQSYGQLNNRAAVEFWQRVWASEYRYDILPVALIHDAAYAIVKDNSAALAWANKNLIECMAWQDLPEIQHPTVKLEAALDVFWPSWANAITLPNNGSEQEVLAACRKGKHKYLNPEPKEKK
jgi:DNA polymerase-1